MGIMQISYVKKRKKKGRGRKGRRKRKMETETERHRQTEVINKFGKKNNLKNWKNSPNASRYTSVY